ncbi:uncharacterized protein Z519_08307 [Cladophialophora bantiana CBS 173.52]|uniref:Unplaced genomic scaffold supercont1.12, whole genome shotgun sequence n=1 Tax=Cladophialophora bantiana (strain ATCC 10958 / CBS 173.52 / CDC B-1940 / NIH 8579) TaxID=1442370 RepID=A0A0D2EN31_CLAB1|nr:uncharacterized protein Z519_08307 [Cladophialophora bantiana CBS 173.52]KIW91411.1 hypothetical protein Z519_08307 [Cladophialophora bantiana CBS 173.52]
METFVGDKGYLLHEPPFQHVPSEKDLESRGLSVGHRVGLIRGSGQVVAKYGLACWAALITLALLLFAFLCRPLILSSGSTDLDHYYPSLDLLALVPAWEWTAYSDDGCNNEIADRNDTGPLPCTNFTSDAAEVDRLTIDMGKHWAICLYTGVNCDTYKGRYDFSKLSCQKGRDSTAYQIIELSETAVCPGEIPVEACDPDACAQQGRGCVCDPLGDQCVC